MCRGVACAIGADRGTALAGMLPIPPDMDEMMFAGFLRRDPVEMVLCETNDLEVPANAEIVLEGYVNLNEMRTEGPFGDHTGFYSLEGEFPVFHVECVTHKKDDLEVPANAEIVLEGYVNLNEMRTEGPFGDHTGFYSLEGEFPVFHVECVTHKKDPIYLTTVVGPPPQEDFYMGYAV